MPDVVANPGAAVLAPVPPQQKFVFLKGDLDTVAKKADDKFDWAEAAGQAREELSEAINARNVAFLLGSGCSSHFVGNAEYGGKLDGVRLRLP